MMVITTSLSCIAEVKDSVRKEVRHILGIDRYMDSLVHKKPILGKVRRYDMMPAPTT